MISGQPLAKNLRRWGVIVGGALLGFALALTLLSLFGHDGIARALETMPPAATAAGLSLLLVLAGVAFGALFAVAQERRRNLLARTALNNMTQALCMYDAAGRLVLCNMRFSASCFAAACRCASCWRSASPPAPSGATRPVTPANASAGRPKAPSIPRRSK
jgi:hypothetical protein